MITSELSRSGHEVLKVGGRLLASSFDPIKEASAWAQRVAHELGARETGIVVGMGCGYHVAALIALRPENTIVVLEPDSEVAARALILNPSVSPEDVIVESDRLRLTDNPRLRDALGGVYRIMPHGPTCQLRPEWAQETVSFLLGRDKTSFLLQLRMRPELFALLDPEAISALGPEAVSIKTLQKLFADKGSPSHERRLWRCLEELVL